MGLIGLQKGVNKTAKGHLLQAERASFSPLKSVYRISLTWKKLTSEQIVCKEDKRNIKGEKQSSKF